MLLLPSVTLLCADCAYVERSIEALERSQREISFGEVKLLTSCATDYKYVVKIDPLPSHNAYSVFCIKRLHEYVNTKHVLVVQHDGWVLNPESWDNDWLTCDYVAPLFTQYNLVGSGGFSLRSKALLEYVSNRHPAWDGSKAGADQMQAFLGYYEDGAMSDASAQNGFKRASLESASRFAQCGNFDPAYRTLRPFGFHRWTNYSHQDAATLTNMNFEHLLPHRGDDEMPELMALRKYSGMCQTVTEMGVHNAVSTWWLLAGLPKRLTSYDIGITSQPWPGQVGANEEEVNKVSSQAEKSGVDFKFKLGSSLEIAIDQTDMLFIDTCHRYQFLKVELERHASNVTKFIALHDTTVFGFTDEYRAHGPDSPGLWPAVEEFLAAHPEWSVRERITTGNGLTILARRV